jgi:hypothetical protein
MNLLKISLIVLVVLVLLPSVIQAEEGEGQQRELPETFIRELDDDLKENSGLIFWDNLIWTINDSGGKNQVYGFDPFTGAVRRTILLLNAANVDWEDIAQDDQYLYIADSGNNMGNRKNLQVLKISKMMITNQSFQAVNVEKIDFNYFEQTNFGPNNKHNSYDCEALFALNDTLYLFSKDWVSNITKAYALPTSPGSYILNPIDSFDVKGLITGADINPEGELALIGYRDFKSFGWIFQKTDSTLFGTPRYINLSMLDYAQTEGICFTPQGDVLFSCEKTENFTQQVWMIRSNKLK